jgi:hypothetical protein
MIDLLKSLSWRFWLFQFAWGIAWSIASVVVFCTIVNEIAK